MVMITYIDRFNVKCVPPYRGLEGSHSSDPHTPDQKIDSGILLRLLKLPRPLSHSWGQALKMDRDKGIGFPKCLALTQAPALLLPDVHLFVHEAQGIVKGMLTVWDPGKSVYNILIQALESVV